MKKKEMKKMPKIIPSEIKQQAIRLYRNSEFQVSEIANLLGLAESTLTKLYCVAFKEGKLKPRNSQIALKARPKKGEGKKGRYVPTGKKRGNPHIAETRKFNDEQELQIAIDYYENCLTTADLKVKWNCHPMQLQRIRKKYGDKYGAKKMGRPKKKEWSGNEEVFNN